MEWVRNCKGRFNSMIVRLKAPILELFVTYTYVFQFYDSPIKSFSSTPCCTFEAWFQFYDSPIKSRIKVILSKYKRRFNSMIVRLKVNTPSITK